jgi:magnesium-protoporphyrin IX monomethyl ester (oxidative) cyclase
LRLVDHVDFVFSGPALKTFPTLVRFLADGQTERCHGIKASSPGTAGRHAGDDLNEVGEELDINKEVHLDYDDYFAALDEKLRAVSHAASALRDLQGCWWGSGLIAPSAA